MFERLFESSNFKSKRRVESVLQRHRCGPYAEERVRFLRHLEEKGYSRFTLRIRAPALLEIASNVNHPISPSGPGGFFELDGCIGILADQ